MALLSADLHMWLDRQAGPVGPGLSASGSLESFADSCTSGVQSAKLVERTAEMGCGNARL